MKLSLCIPTYNRSKFLKKNLLIIIGQIKLLKYYDCVQICISDNCSIDDTEAVVEKITNMNKDVNVLYRKNQENLGADKNFIAVMKMAEYEYSILLGDDDFFKPQAIKTIFSIVKSSIKADIFLANRTEILENGSFFRERKFLACKSKLFEFNKKEDAISYFNNIVTLGGALCFISSVIYKTSIIKSDFNPIFYGTQYAFLYYFWKCLLAGGFLQYNDISYINSVAGGTNNNYGNGVKRAVIDYFGFYKYGESLFKDTYYYYDWIKLPNLDHNWYSLALLYISERKEFERDLEPFLIKAGWSEEHITDLKKSVSDKFILRLLFRKYCPTSIRQFLGYN